MIYNNETVRRQDRLLPENEAIELLKGGEYGILSMQAEDEGGYGIPVNYAWDNKDSIYIHCAPDGKKLRNLNVYNKVSFCVIGATKIISNKFTTEYRSIILQGKAYTGLSANERMKALEFILDKYSPNDKVVGMKYAEKSFNRTEIIRIDIEWLSGKCKKMI